jgi:hypothetical protein
MSFIRLTGTYQGRNLIVQNPFTTDGFCATLVQVNDESLTDENSFSQFEINLAGRHLKHGDAVEVKIHHRDGCTPKVLNPEALK